MKYIVTVTTPGGTTLALTQRDTWVIMYPAVNDYLWRTFNGPDEAAHTCERKRIAIEKQYPGQGYIVKVDTF